MDIATILETLGEPQTIALLGFILAFIFGVVAERSGFCTRSAVIEIVNGAITRMLPLWLLAFSSAILVVQYSIHSNWIDVSETRFFATPLSLSGAIIGGSLFGIGMALARGCPSRLLVLGASGNIRAIVAIFIMGVFAWMTLQGPFTGMRDAIGGLLSTALVGTNDLLTLGSLGTIGGVAIGLVLFAVSIFVAIRKKLSCVMSAAGIAIGAVVALGWYYTYQISTQVFEPIQAESLSFIRPSASTYNYLANIGDETYLNLDIGLFAGVIAGAFLSSILFGSFKIQKFSDVGAPHFSRYLSGGALMGFGGILSVGCTIGAGFTGGSVLSISSLIALATMIIACGITVLLLRKPS